jgi:2,5-diketo-D-gluconate reductase A
MDTLGFGTYKLDEKTCYHMCLEALKVGYRHLDTAQLYRNERSVALAIVDSNVARDDIFLTTKLHWKPIKKGREAIVAAVSEQLEIFGGRIDLLLLHRATPNYQEAWSVLTNDIDREAVRHVGVSNFSLEQIQTLKPKPYAHQFQLNPETLDSKMLDYLHKHQIKPVVFANMGRTDQRGMTVPDWIKWSRKLGTTPLCQTSNKDHLLSNFI